jgi:hypothetical protein
MSGASSGWDPIASDRRLEGAGGPRWRVEDRDSACRPAMAPSRRQRSRGGHACAQVVRHGMVRLIVGLDHANPPGGDEYHHRQRRSEARAARASRQEVHGHPLYAQETCQHPGRGNRSTLRPTGSIVHGRSRAEVWCALLTVAWVPQGPMRSRPRALIARSAARGERSARWRGASVLIAHELPALRPEPCHLSARGRCEPAAPPRGHPRGPW